MVKFIFCTKLEGPSTHFFIHSFFQQYLFKMYCMTEIMLGYDMGDTKMIRQSPFPHKANSLLGYSKKKKKSLGNFFLAY